VKGKKKGVEFGKREMVELLRERFSGKGEAEKRKARRKMEGAATVKTGPGIQRRSRWGEQFIVI